ncbi:carbohydrate kinase [Sinanaerobacter sp. ZZT-01]|uniref:carbohydrate kinase family protein n=1 Tax=Sinanaerobacter sp. ZZT-01 TaxID=3111540 RepID=UPI002D76FBA5|nr:carbohydrate kinase [Sinanaerobacter sp. ZZT-01]WRR92330.1 carbohydrate kinase [Sinanaerobacter sp. ZZT-01]
METHDIIALGELVINFQQQENGSYVPNLGGSPANLIRIPAKCGLQTALIGKIGTDSFGKKALYTLRQLSVDTTSIITDPNVFTSLAFINKHETGQSVYEFVRKPGSDIYYKKEELPVSMLKHTKIFHFSSLSLTHPISRDAVFEAVRIARESGAVISFEASYLDGVWTDKAEAKKQILRGIKDADLVDITQQDLDFLEVFPIDLLHQYSSHFILINMGENGCRYVGRDGEGYVQGIKQLPKMDTRINADIFMGAVLSRFLALSIPIKQLSSLNLEDILHFANKTASLCDCQDQKLINC